MDTISTRIKGLISSVIELVQVRFQLLGVEAREELIRLLGMIAFGALALVTFCLGLVFCGFLIIAMHWDTPNRLWAVGWVWIFFWLITLGSGIWAWSRFNRGTELFKHSLHELGEDVERLKR